MRWILLALILSIGSAWSGDPVKPQPKDGKHNSSAQQRCTQESPCFVKGDVTTKKNAQETEDDGKRRIEKASIDEALVKYTGLTALFTLLLFAAASVQVGLFVWQLRLIGQATRDAGIAADTAKKSADAVMLAERAYVKVSPCPPGIEGNSTREAILTMYGANFEIKNHGQTPARITDLVVLSRFLKEGESLPKTPDYARAQGHTFAGAFLVREEHFFYLFTDFTNLSSIAAIGRRGIKSGGEYFVYGYVDYIDVFEQRHRGGFARVYEPRIDNRELYDGDSSFAERCNLVFVSQRGYDYDRPRKQDEGHDWEEKPSS